MQDADLGRALAAERQSRPRRERGCPSAEELIAAASAARGAASRPELAAHLAICPDCAAELSLAGELRAWSEEAAPGAASTSRPARRWTAPQVWVPLAAGLLVGALGLALFEARRAGDDNELRGSTAHVWVVEPRDGSELDVVPLRLAWPAVIGADSYRVDIFDGESRPVFRSPELSEPALDLPDDLPLAAGATYYWRVTAFRGVAEERSPLFGFSIAP